MASGLSVCCCFSQSGQRSLEKTQQECSQCVCKGGNVEFSLHPLCVFRSLSDDYLILCVCEVEPGVYLLVSA